MIDQNQIKLAAKALNQGGLVVFPTDTIYGLLGSALNQATVEKIYQLRQRTPSKPLIVLIANLEDLRLFDINLTSQDQALINQLWPNPVSIILPCSNPKFDYLHRGTQTLAFRLPANSDLISLLHQTGPLVAPSANFEGQPSAKNVAEARQYFADQVDHYVDGGDLIAEPSTLISLDHGQIQILRQGAYQLPD